MYRQAHNSMPSHHVATYSAESQGLRSASAQYTKRAIRALIKRQLVFTRVSPSLTLDFSGSNDDKIEEGLTPDGDDLLKEQVKWKQPCADQASPPRPPHY